MNREQWTQFNVIHMSVGLAMMVAVTVTVVWLGWLPLLLQASPSAQCYAAVSLCLCTWHAVSMLSNSFIIEVTIKYIQFINRLRYISNYCGRKITRSIGSCCSRSRRVP